MKNKAKKVLKELREKFGVSDEAVAAKLRVSSVSVYRWRNGINYPSFSELSVINRILEGHRNKAK